MTTTGRQPDQHEQPHTATGHRPDGDHPGDRSPSGVARIQPTRLITATSPADPAQLARLRVHATRVPLPGPVWLDEVQFDSLADALMAVGRQIAESLAGMAEAAEALQNAGLLPELPPTDPRARALWLRQNRNTGPAQRHRAPRNLDTTGRHGRRSTW